MNRDNFYHRRGYVVPLGGELGRGGEGVIREVAGLPRYVAKIYLQPLVPEKEAKLVAMVSFGHRWPWEYCAWPIATLHETPNGSVVGFLMKRAGGRVLHELYDPTDRELLFPKKDWRFLIHVARNLACAFHAVHSAGCVIGDVNENLARVDQEKGEVTLLDCDSFQISAGGRLFPCRVGVSPFTPPELQGFSLESTQRTQNQDCFGLAELIFMLLFMGRHPFVGRSQRRDDLPIEKAIKEFQFAFGGSTPGLEPPRSALALDAIPRQVSDMFQKAFTQDGVRRGRPNAREWIDALDCLRTELVQCREHPRHMYYRGNATCPWCEICGQGGPDFFDLDRLVSRPVSASGDSGFNLAALWDTVKTIPVPDPVSERRGRSPSHVKARVLPSTVGRAIHLSRLAGWAAIPVSALVFAIPLVGVILTLTLVLIWLGFGKMPQVETERGGRRRALKQTEDAFNILAEVWDRELGGMAASIKSERAELEKKKAEYEKQKDQRELQRALNDGSSRLRALWDAYSRRRSELLPTLEKAAMEYAQARADASLL